MKLKMQDQGKTIPANLADIKNLIAVYEKKYKRIARSIRLLAVSKGQSLAAIRLAIASGQFIFGENYLQEALPKIHELAGQPLEWHFIGPIQNNKTRKIAENFSWVESLADAKTAKRLNDQRPKHLPPLNICLQVNVSGEASKTGLNADQTANLAAYCLTLTRLRLRGLMTIPAPSSSMQVQRRQFQQVYLLWENLRQQGFDLDTLSMGMSADLEAAIAEGTTQVRIGTAIFGRR